VGEVLKLLRFKSKAGEGLGIPVERYDPERDGVSHSLLSKWKRCRELARLHLMGWRSRGSRPGQTFGDLVHAVLERVYGQIQSGKIKTIPTERQVKQVITKVELAWRKKNTRADSDAISTMEMMLLLVEAIMPIYFTFYHKDLTRMDWFHLEQFIGDVKRGRTFGRHVTHLIGKIDGAFRPGDKKKLWLFETKTKGRLGESGESNLSDIMHFEAQTHLYLGALQDVTGEVPGGVLLNIIRRPNLKVKKNESLRAFNERLIADIKTRPRYYFIRLRMDISKSDLESQRRSLDGQFTDFLAWFHGETPHYQNSDACEDKNGSCEMIRICGRRDFTGMYQLPPRRKDQIGDRL
jgi:hypothetical protein